MLYIFNSVCKDPINTDPELQMLYFSKGESEVRALVYIDVP